MDILIILVLTLANALLALGEMAIVSARRTRLQQLADEGDGGAKRALALVANPGQFLSTVQVGITAITILTGVWGEAALSKDFARWLQVRADWMAPYHAEVAIVIVVGLITLLSVVFGELVPKRLALAAPERIAVLAAPPLTLLAAVFAPAVRLFNLLSDLALRLLGVQVRPEDQTVSEEEIKVMLQQGAEQGEVQETEEQLVRNVFRLDDLRVAAIMTHRVDIYFLDVQEPEDVLHQRIADSPYSRIPVCDGGTDNIIGVVNAKNLLARALAGEKLELRSAAKPPIFVPGTITAMQLLENFQASKTDVAFVVDEYGEVQGLATLADVMQAIVGDVAVNDPKQESMAVQRADGSWLVDGALPLERLEELLDFDRDALDDEDHYHTVAGLVMTKLGHVPTTGEELQWHSLRFEVVDMDRNRIDKVLIRREAPSEAPST